MVSDKVIKTAIKDVAFEKKLNTKQIEALMKVGGVKDLLINPLVCMKCGKQTSVVGQYMTCEPCEETLSGSDKKFLIDMGATPMFEDDFQDIQEGGLVE